MPRRGENIRKRKDGRWEARYPKGTNNSGKTIYGSVYADSYREVKQKRENIQKTCICTTTPSNTTLAAIIEHWLDNKITQKASTIYRYRYIFQKHILPELGRKNISNLTSSEINNFLISKLANGRLDKTGGLSPSYVRSIAIIISSAINNAVEEGLCFPPQGKIKKPQAPSSKIVIMPQPDQKKLEDMLIANLNGTTLGIAISLYSGLRIGEVCALRWGDLDFENDLIYVRNTVVRIQHKDKGTVLILDAPKTPSSTRVIPICSRLKNYFQQYAPGAKDHFVVTNGPEFISPRTFSYRYKKVLSSADVPYLNYHVLRHTFATRCVEADVDIKSLSEMLGHANVSISLNTYVHSSTKTKRVQLEKMVAKNE